MRFGILLLFALAMLAGGCDGRSGPEPDRDPSPKLSASVAAFTADELRARRSALVEEFPDGIALIPAGSAPKKMEQPGWIQRPSFYYLSGLLEGANAILAVDGPRGTSTLYVGGPPSMFGSAATDATIPPADVVAERTGIEEVRDWSVFVSDIRKRVEEGTMLYIEASGAGGGGTPPGMAPVDDFDAAWTRAVESAFPGAEISNVSPVVNRLRWRKSPAEIERMRVNAAASAAALVAGMRAVRPGLTQIGRAHV